MRNCHCSSKAIKNIPHCLEVASNMIPLSTINPRLSLLSVQVNRNIAQYYSWPLLKKVAVRGLLWGCTDFIWSKHKSNFNTSQQQHTMSQKKDACSAHTICLAGINPSLLAVLVMWRSDEDRTVRSTGSRSGERTGLRKPSSSTVWLDQDEQACWDLFERALKYTWEALGNYKYQYAICLGLFPFSMMEEEGVHRIAPSYW